MSKQGYLPDENLSDSFLIRRIRQIIARCDADLKADTIQSRESYEQIKAFHFDAIRKEVSIWFHPEGEE